MKKIGLIAAAGMLAAAGTAFGQGSLNLEITTPDGPAGSGYQTGPATWDGEGGSFTITLMVRAQLLGDAAATGLTTFVGFLTDDGTGTFDKAALTGAEAFGIPYDGFPGADPQGRTGLTPDYRSVVSDNGADANGLIDPLGWKITPISTAPAGVAGAVAGLDDVYKFTWTTTDNSARTVTLNISAAGFGYQAGGVRQGTDIDGGSFVIEIVPAPGAAALLGLGGLVAIRRRR